MAPMATPLLTTASVPSPLVDLLAPIFDWTFY